jgi:hypothetical protein
MENKPEESRCECGDGKACACDCACDCDCECCRSGKCTCKHNAPDGEKQHNPIKDAITFAQSAVRTNDTVGAVFLGTLAILLLIFLVRSNKRNRELLLEVIELRQTN